MTFSYFTDQQIIPLIVSSIILVAATVTFHSDKKRAALVLLFIGSLGLGFFTASLDNFLILWDEQYHALVARHMLDNPFRPTLYATPLLPYDYHNWTFNHIWLHKQPLFLWQIALSLKIFGINTLAVRIPDIILHAIATLMIYRIGKISNSQTVGFYGALFFSVAFYPLELLAGKYPTDHNDFSFMFYILATFWSWFEYQKSQKKYWLLLTGIFSGCAVLVKWLTGLLIYLVWAISIMVTGRNNRLKLKSYFPVLVSFAIALAVFIPWQLYIFNMYPDEAKYEFQLNSAHLSQVIENHGGDYWFHFNAIKDIYGSGTLVPFMVLLGIILLVKNATAAIFRVAILSAIIITYGLYTIAATKMISYCIIVCPFAFLGLGALADSILTFLSAKIKARNFDRISRPVALILVSYFLLNPSRIERYHTDRKPTDNCNRKADLEQMSLIKQISARLQGGKYAVFNAGKRLNGHIAVMFYTDCVAYDFIPNEEQVEMIKAKSYKIAIADNDSLPGFIRNDNEIIKLNDAWPTSEQ